MNEKAAYEASGEGRRPIERLCSCACGCQIGPDVPDVCVWCRWEPSCVAQREAAQKPEEER